MVLGPNVTFLVVSTSRLVGLLHFCLCGFGVLILSFLLFVFLVLLLFVLS